MNSVATKRDVGDMVFLGDVPIPNHQSVGIFPLISYHYMSKALDINDSKYNSKTVLESRMYNKGGGKDGNEKKH